jgi:MFS family permease
MRKNLGPIASLLLGIGFLLAGNGLLFTLLPLRGAAENFGEVGLGVIGSLYYVGFVAGCVLAPYAILNAGHIRAFAALVALAVTVSLAFGLAANVYAWAGLRLVNGFCLAGIYLIIESWLNNRTSNDTRGMVMSAYVMVNFSAFTVGQALVTLYPIEQAGGFMIAAILGSLGIIPVALTRSAQPAPITIVRFHPVKLYRAAPVGLVAAFMVGVANGAFWSLGPISASGSGLDVTHVAMFMSATTLAGALSQWPVGRLSDRIDRRLVLFGVLTGASLTGLALWLSAPSGTTLIFFGLAFGALTLPCYSLAAAHAYDKTPASDTVATAATVLLANALGAVVGPLLASGVMRALEPSALFLFIAGAQAVLAVYVFYRTKVQASLTTDEKTDFGMAASAPAGSMLTPDVPDPSDPSVVAPRDDVDEKPGGR